MDTLIWQQRLSYPIMGETSEREATEKGEAGEKEKAAAICDSCGEITPVRVWSDGHIHPIGEDDGRCCADGEYRVLEHGESVDAFE